MKTKSCRKCSPQGKRCDCPTSRGLSQNTEPMETMTDTPETDGEWNRLACQDHPEFERNLADFARKLERERDEARKWGCMRVFQLAQERDEIRTQLRKEQRLHVQTLNERDEAREIL